MNRWRCTSALRMSHVWTSIYCSLRSAISLLVAVWMVFELSVLLEFRKLRVRFLFGALRCSESAKQLEYLRNKNYWMSSNLACAHFRYSHLPRLLLGKYRTRPRQLLSLLYVWWWPFWFFVAFLDLSFTSEKGKYCYKNVSHHILLFSGGKIFEGENIVNWTDIVFDLFLDVNCINVFLKTFVKTRICDLIRYKSVKQSPGERF